ncbi:hypothetical protein M6B38_205015 [Iris pallida]|uniref:Uncharacterized protein n=1 Tax=Iris pallida TaxID=29817 RepID=A0AAX6E852_IRIPA|nr:hypothetical protein M6B38_205010 [Iris pallida]KAJ6800141.1 hypothetical protein M6B38_205015 [Iris pallida]
MGMMESIQRVKFFCCSRMFLKLQWSKKGISGLQCLWLGFDRRFRHFLEYSEKRFKVKLSFCMWYLFTVLLRVCLAIVG